MQRTLDRSDPRLQDPLQTRQLIRQGVLNTHTGGLCLGRAHANLAILPKADAFEFLLFCQRNPKPCPVLEVLDPGDPVPHLTAPTADIRTDVPRYRVFRHGQLAEEPHDIRHLWRDDLVAFLLGCSFSFEGAMLRAGLPLRYQEENVVVSCYDTNIECKPAGKFRGPMVVSMRPVKADKVPLAVMVTGRYPAVHGAPIHVGDPSLIGIRDLNKTDYGDPVTIHPDEVPVFWACGITPQAVALRAKPELMITHYPGHMFITDLTDEQVAVQ